MEPVQTSHTCSECKVTNSRGNLYFLHVNELEQARVSVGDCLKNIFLGLEHSIIGLGYYTMPGWSGHVMWYAFQCPECSELSIDYVHGWAYLSCQSCNFNLDVYGDRFYTNDGRKASPGFIESMLEILRLKRELEVISGENSLKP